MINKCSRIFSILLFTQLCAYGLLVEDLNANESSIVRVQVKPDSLSEYEFEPLDAWVILVQAVNERGESIGIPYDSVTNIRGYASVVIPDEILKYPLKIIAVNESSNKYYKAFYPKVNDLTQTIEIGSLTTAVWNMFFLREKICFIENNEEDGTRGEECESFRGAVVKGFSPNKILQSDWTKALSVFKMLLKL